MKDNGKKEKKENGGGDRIHRKGDVGSKGRDVTMDSPPDSEKGGDDPWKDTDGRRDSRQEVIRERMKEALGGDGRVTLPDAALEMLVKSSMQDLIDRGILVKDPETGEYDLREDVERRRAEKEAGKDR